MTVDAVPPGSCSAYAALDLGTHNCRMLVARPVGRGFRVIDAFSRITRLGEGLAASGRLSEAAMDRTIQALQVCADKLERNRVVQARLVATEACRRAVNGGAFQARVAAETGLDLEIISAHEEARLALAGCASLMRPEREWALVFDIGGGSTELVWVRRDGADQEVCGTKSLPFGVVTLSEQARDDLGCSEGYDRVVGTLVERMAAFEARHDIVRRVRTGEAQMLGTSGTVTTLAALHLGLDRYDRSAVDGVDLRLADIAAVTRMVTNMTPGGRAEHGCIGPERADLVVAGCAILEAMCRLWPLESLRVADRGVREGVLLELMCGMNRGDWRVRA